MRPLYARHACSSAREGRAKGCRVFRSRSRSRSFRAFPIRLLEVREKSESSTASAAHVIDGPGPCETRLTHVRRTIRELLRYPGVACLGPGLLPEEERPRASIPVAVASYEKWRSREFDRKFVAAREDHRMTSIVGARAGVYRNDALVAPEVWLPLACSTCGQTTIQEAW